MFRKTTMRCKFKSEGEAKAHLPTLEKSPRVIACGYDCDDKFGHHTWWIAEEWVNKEVIEND